MPEPRRRRSRPRVLTLMILVAAVAVALGALRTVREGGDAELAFARHLIGTLESGDPAARRSAAEALAETHEAGARAAVPALIRALGDPDPGVRAVAADSLGHAARRSRYSGGSDAELRAAGEALVVALKDGEASVRAAAAGSIGMLVLDPSGASPSVSTAGRQGVRSVAVPALVEAAADPDPGVRRAVFMSLELVIVRSEGEPPPVLLQAMAAGRPAEMRAAAAYAVYVGWPDSKAVAEALAAALGDGDPAVRRGAVAALLAVDDRAPPDVDYSGLVAALDDEEHSYQREFLVKLLARYGPAARSAVPKLAAVARRARNEPDGTGALFFEAVAALAAIDPSAPEAREFIPDLVAILDTPNDYRLTIALPALARFGPSARSALPGLRALSNHPELPPPWRRLVLGALLAIDVPDASPPANP